MVFCQFGGASRALFVRKAEPVRAEAARAVAVGLAALHDVAALVYQRPVLERRLHDRANLTEAAWVRTVPPLRIKRKT